MNVPEGPYRGTRVRLPADVVRPFDVFLNGVAQEEGRDYRIDGRTLVFDRELRTEGKLGFWRWLSLWVGIAGTYRQNDSVDVAYRRDGKPVVASASPARAALGVVRGARRSARACARRLELARSLLAEARQQPAVERLHRLQAARRALLVQRR